MAKFIRYLIGIAAVLMLAGIVVNYVQDERAAYTREYTSTATRPGEDVVVTIPEDASDRQIALILKNDGLIRYRSAFTRRLKKSEYEGHILAGNYTVNTGMNTLDMMKAMATMEDPEKEIKTLVVPEGFTVDQIAARCEEEDICSADAFTSAVQSVTESEFPYLADVPGGADVRYALEGYLFPATYEVRETDRPTDLVKQMLDAFSNYYTAEMQAEAEGMGLNSYQVITMASMIEREAKIDEERPKIAAVLFNRLKQNMKLQVDSTVLYPITDGMYDQPKVTERDLEYDSPYNTYLYDGLPAGPICNPGTACINAVLNPDQDNYLYYRIIDEDTGEHSFSETYEEHQEAGTSEETEAGSDNDEYNADGAGQ